jgi:hypothetical protein
VLVSPPRPDEHEGARASAAADLATASSTIYTVLMSIRAMQEATYLILTALASGSQHGYGIIADVSEISDGRVRLRAGTLYTALDRLRADGLIVVDREEIVENRLRRGVAHRPGRMRASVHRDVRLVPPPRTAGRDSVARDLRVHVGASPRNGYQQLLSLGTSPPDQAGPNSPASRSAPSAGARTSSWRTWPSM